MLSPPLAKLPEWIVDARRPINAGYDFPVGTAAAGKALAMNTEGEFDHPRDAVRFSRRHHILKRLGISACRFHQTVQVFLADHPELGGTHGLAMPPACVQQLCDIVAVGFVASEEIMQRNMRGTDFFKHRLLLCGGRQAAKLADELPNRNASSVRDVRGHVAPEPALVVTWAG
jgi:hypothetical protein